ncbi:MAG: beta-propeller domain-containing protein, partial [Myxococcota bacterium]|nr:beta-propeller domain-containing protein [Myxococcota bacterium]
MKSRSLHSLLVLSCLVSVAGCSRTDPQYSLEPFKSCDALERNIKDQAMTQIRWQHAWGGGGYGWGGFGYSAEMGMDDGMVAAPEASDVGNSGASSHSTTNLQESAVDEADLVKTDGLYMYSIAGDHLLISQAWPDELDDDTEGWNPDWESVGEVSRMALEGSADGMYLLEDKTLIVISQLGGEDGEPEAGGSIENSTYQYSSRGLVKVTIVDASDAAAPVVLRETYTPGMLFTSRMVSGRLYTVTYTPLGLESVGQSQDKSESINLVKDSELSDWLPSRFDHSRASIDADWTVEQEPVCDCENVYGSERESGDWLVSVQALDTADLTSEFHGTSVLTSVDTVYASADSLYVVSSESRDEGSPWQSYDSSIDTFVHQFDITDGPLNPSYS